MPLPPSGGCGHNSRETLGAMAHSTAGADGHLDIRFTSVRLSGIAVGQWISPSESSEIKGETKSLHIGSGLRCS